MTIIAVILEVLAHLLNTVHGMKEPFAPPMADKEAGGCVPAVDGRDSTNEESDSLVHCLMMYVLIACRVLTVSRVRSFLSSQSILLSRIFSPRLL